MFYVTSKLELASGLREGSAFAAGQAVAFDPSFFAEGRGGLAYKTGLLARVAVTPLDQTYEDSCVLTRKLAEETAALVTMMRPVSLSRGANLQSYAKVGDEVTPDTPLAVFENVSDEADVAALLARVGAEFDEAIAGLATNQVYSRYAGRVVEVRTYYNVDPALMSESLRAYLRAAAAASEARARAAPGAPPDLVRAGAPERIDRDKAEGEQFDGVLICFFVQVEDVGGPGDKYTVSGAALKSIVARVLEPGEEPYDESGNQVDYVLSPLSIVSRMVVDSFLTLWTNACIVGLRDRALAILDE